MKMIDKCEKCEHHATTALFEECKHPTSQYTRNERVQWHTVGHMRSKGGCGESALYFKSKVPE